MTLARIIAVLVMASACLPLCAVGKASVTKGVKCEAPSFDLMPYTVSGELSAIQIPNDGWKVDWPSEEYKPATNSVPGIKIVSTNVIIRGAVKPALVLGQRYGEIPDPFLHHTAQHREALDIHGSFGGTRHQVQVRRHAPCLLLPTPRKALGNPCKEGGGLVKLVPHDTKFGGLMQNALPLYQAV